MSCRLSSVGGVLAQGVHQHVGAEHVVAHGGQGLVGVAGPRGGIGRLLQEGLHLVPVPADADDPELGGLGPRHRDRRHGHPGAAVQVLVDDLLRVHPVDVVGADHHHQVGPLVVDQVQRLVDRVGGPGVPLRAEPLLGRDRGHVVAEQDAHPPGLADVPVQAVALVLGQHADAQAAAVDQVGQREIDQPVEAAERDGGLGPVRGQRRQPLAGPAGQHDPQDAWLGHR